MHKRGRDSGPRRWRLACQGIVWLAAAVCAVVCPPAHAQAVTTTVSDTVYSASGAGATGTVLVSWPAFTTVNGQTVPKGSTSITLGTGGALSVQLAPNVGAVPAGTYYTAVYHLSDGSVSREYWVVPVSSIPVSLTAIRSSVLPTSVAMQTVTKQYVDQAIAKAALTGLAPQDASPYVEKAGDTMSGPLILAGDPTSGLQAATKNYVDANSGGSGGGLAQKVSTVPQATQTVIQPDGTQLQVNTLNGELYAKEYASSAGSDGTANALASGNCASGCTVVLDPSYQGNEVVPLTKTKTMFDDQRGNLMNETAVDPAAGTGHSIHTYSSVAAPARLAQGLNVADQYGLSVTETALSGGNNLFPLGFSSIPYFKTTYSGLAVMGQNYTQGQHVLTNNLQRCNGVGDCLLGAQFLYSSGGQRDNADEGTHPFDISIEEDIEVFQGTCSTGCSTGSTQLLVATTSGGSNPGDGRYLINKTAGKTLTGGSVVGASTNGIHALALFSGTSFPLSTLFTTTANISPQSSDMAPGTVSVAIKTSGVASGYSTNTASASAGSGLACLADPVSTSGADHFEMANYTVVDGSHIRLTLNKPHVAGATIALGGLCGYGVEQAVDTVGNIRQVFPVIGSPTATSLLYSGLASANLGNMGGASAFANVSVVITGMQRNANVVTVDVSPALPYDLNGLAVTIGGASDSSFNGTFTATTNSPTEFTFTQSGANASTSGGTVSLLTGTYTLYPMAEVLRVTNSATNRVDGTFVLAPNRVAWAAGDVVEEPHFYQERVAADTHFVTQYTPRGSLDVAPGIQYNGTVGAYLTGWQVYNNAPGSQYYGNGGTHTAPAAGMAVKGVWQTSLDLQAGEQSGITMRCNSHGCLRWNSAYNLFSLQSSAGFDSVSYSPSTSTMTWNMRGAQYSMSPTSLTAGTINATTLNVTRINGLQQATPAAVGGVTLGPAASTAVLANIATSGSASDLTSGTIDPARLPAGYGGGGGASNCASSVAYSATPTFAVSCPNATFHMPLSGNVTGEAFTGLAAGQRITLIFQVGGTPGYTVAWSPAVHGGFVTSSSSSAAGYTQAGKYLVQQLVVDADGTTLLNPGAINE